MPPYLPSRILLRPGWSGHREENISLHGFKGLVRIKVWERMKVLVIRTIFVYETQVEDTLALSPRLLFGPNTHNIHHTTSNDLLQQMVVWNDAKIVPRMVPEIFQKPAQDTNTSRVILVLGKKLTFALLSSCFGFELIRKLCIPRSQSWFFPAEGGREVMAVKFKMTGSPDINGSPKPTVVSDG